MVPLRWFLAVEGIEYEFERKLAFMSADWVTLIVNREGFILIFLNYIFFSLIVLSCLLFLLCLAHSSSPPWNMMTSLTILAFSFVMVNMVLADYVVQTIHSKRDFKHFL